MSNEKTSNTVKQVGIVVAVVAIAALIFFGGIRYQKRESTITEKYLQEQVEKAREQADYWEGRYNALQEEKTTLLLKVDSLDYRIKELKKSYGQKVTTVKSYSNPELERFFTERYGN